MENLHIANFHLFSATYLIIISTLLVSQHFTCLQRHWPLTSLLIWFWTLEKQPSEEGILLCYLR